MVQLSPDQWDTLLGTPAPAAPYAPYGYDEWGNPLPAPAPPPIPSAIQTTAPVAAQAQGTYQQALDVAFNWTPPTNYLPPEISHQGLSTGQQVGILPPDAAANAEAQYGGQDIGFDFAGILAQRAGELGYDVPAYAPPPPGAPTYDYGQGTTTTKPGSIALAQQNALSQSGQLPPQEQQSLYRNILGQTGGNAPVFGNALSSIGELGLKGLAAVQQVQDTRAPGGAMFVTPTGTYGGTTDYWKAAQLPSDQAKAAAINLIGDNPTGRTIGELLNLGLDPVFIASIFAGGGGILANTLGRGSMRTLPYVTSSLAAQGGVELAQELGAPAGVQLVAAIPAAVLGAYAPAAAGIATGLAVQGAKNTALEAAARTATSGNLNRVLPTSVLPTERATALMAGRAGQDPLQAVRDIQKGRIEYPLSGAGQSEDIAGQIIRAANGFLAAARNHQHGPDYLREFASARGLPIPANITKKADMVAHIERLKADADAILKNVDTTPTGNAALADVPVAEGYGGGASRGPGNRAGNIDVPPGQLSQDQGAFGDFVQQAAANPRVETPTPLGPLLDAGPTPGGAIPTGRPAPVSLDQMRALYGRDLSDDALGQLTIMAENGMSPENLGRQADLYREFPEFKVTSNPWAQDLNLEAQATQLRGEATPGPANYDVPPSAPVKLDREQLRVIEEARQNMWINERGVRELYDLANMGATPAQLRRQAGLLRETPAFRINIGNERGGNLSLAGQETQLRGTVTEGPGNLQIPASKPLTAKERIQAAKLGMGGAGDIGVPVAPAAERSGRFDKPLSDVANIHRNLGAGADQSNMFRQGKGIIRHVGAWWRGFKEAQQATFSEEAAKTLQAQMRADKRAEEAGLFLSDLPGEGVGGMTRREEQYASDWVSGLPIYRQTGRGNVIFLNRLRLDTFNQVVNSWDRARVAAEEGRASWWQRNVTLKGMRPGDEKALATYINRATGRGTLGRLEGTELEGLLGITAFSPRYQASLIQRRMQLLNYKNPLVMAEAWKDFLADYGATIGILALADKTGVADVNLDPRSSDFGKFKIGNRRIDPWAGWQQIATLSARMLSGEYASGQSITEGGAWEDRLKLLQNFARSKAAPTVGTVYDLTIGKGKDPIGQKITEESVLTSLLPIYVQSTYEAAQEGLLGESLTTLPASFFGLSTDTYAPTPAKALEDAANALNPPYPWAEMGRAEKREFVMQNPSLTDKYKAADAAREGESVRLQRQRDLELDRISDLANKRPDEYREKVSAILGDYNNFREYAVENGIIKVSGEPAGDLAIAMDGFFKAADQAKTTAGTDYDLREKLTSDYLNTLTPEMRERVMKELAFATNPQYAALLRDRQTIAPYWEIRDKAWDALTASNPMFAGSTSEEDWRNRRIEQLKQEGFGEEIAATIADALLEAFAAPAQIEQMVYLISHPEVLALLDRWKYDFPADFAALLPYYAARLTGTTPEQRQFEMAGR